MAEALDNAPVAKNPPNVITLRDMLAQRVASGERFRLSEVVSIVVPLCTDLATRHAAGETAYLSAASIGTGLDGVARLIPELSRTKPTDARDVVALAPELSSAAPNARSSVFAIGALVYEMLTLKPVGPGMQPPSKVCPGVPDMVDNILAKALVTDPSLRPDDLPAFAQALHHFAPASVAPPPLADETAFEVDLDLRSSMLPPAAPEVNLANPVIPRSAPVRMKAPDDPFGAVVEAPKGPAPKSKTVEELSALKSRLEADPAPRWIVVKDKMDHGPFAALELLQQLAVDTFTEEALLVDTYDGSRVPISQHPEFSRFAHHAALKREQVKEAKAVVALEKSEKTAGTAKTVIGIAAIIAVIGIAVFVVLKIKGRADEEERRKRESEISLQGEGSVSAKVKEKPKVALGGGPGGAGWGGKGYDDALKNTVSDMDAETLSQKECGAPVSGSIALNCGLNGKATAKYVVKNGRALGVTVTTEPSQPGVNTCIAGQIGGLSWRSVTGATGCTKWFKTN